MLKETRDATIFKLWDRGWSYQRIAARYNLSLSSITKIIFEQKQITKWRKAA
jgi:Mor family transcriptional regulator